MMLKKDRDHWRNAAENHQKLLTAGQGERDQKDEELRSMIAELRTQVDVLSKKRGGFWRWFEAGQDNRAGHYRTPDDMKAD